MSNQFLISFSVIMYLIPTGLLVYKLFNRKPSAQISKTDTLVWLCAILAFISHALYAWNISAFSDGIQNINLSAMTALISCLIAAFFLVGKLFMPIQTLGVLLYPACIVSLIFSFKWSGTPSQGFSGDSALYWHILVSISAYALMAIACIQAILYFSQEKLLQRKTRPSLLLSLPPLQTMETLLFRILLIGFVLLSITLASGLIFSQQIFGQPFVFKHHTILAILGWGTFAWLLFLRMKDGIRGGKAVTLTVIGFAFLQLGYFGTKLIQESIA